MSCNNTQLTGTNSSSSKNKHYTPMERKVFLQILDSYKHVIELKKSDGTTIKDKDIAWKEVCNKYNMSALIYQERTVQQLKKLWTNIKQTQREAITKERQARMATGGGPPQPEASIDPDVANIAPHLMETAPVLFSSNMSEKEIEDKRELTFDMVSNNYTIDLIPELIIENKKDGTNKESDNDVLFVDCTNTLNIEKDSFNTTKKDNTLCRREQQTDMQNEQSSNILDDGKLKQTRSLKRKRNAIDETKLLSTEEMLRMERIKRVMEQDEQLAHIKEKHETNMNNMKENHLKEINNLELQHLKQMQTLEIEIKQAQLRAIESRKNKENIDTFRI